MKGVQWCFRHAGIFKPVRIAPHGDSCKDGEVLQVAIMPAAMMQLEQGRALTGLEVSVQGDETAQHACYAESPIEPSP